MEADMATNEMEGAEPVAGGLATGEEGDGDTTIPPIKLDAGKKRVQGTRIYDFADFLIFLQTTLLVYLMIEFNSLISGTVIAQELADKGSRCAYHLDGLVQDFTTRINEERNSAAGTTGLSNHAIFAYSDALDIQTAREGKCTSSPVFVIFLAILTFLQVGATIWLYVAKATISDQATIEYMKWHEYFRVFSPSFMAVIGTAIMLIILSDQYICCYGWAPCIVGSCELMAILSVVGRKLILRCFGFVSFVIPDAIEKMVSPREVI